MDESFKKQIEEAKNILVLLPIDPRLDEVAAGLSLHLALEGTKSSSISCPSQMTVEFSRLIGVNKVTTELGNKNLIIKFPNYPANEIEKVSYDIDKEQFTLTVIPKEGVPAPKQSQINTTYAGGVSDTIIILGGEKEEHFPALNNPDLKDAKIIHLGNRILETKNISVLSFAKPASSISEIVAKIIKDNSWKLDKDIATNILAGIEGGSFSFQTKDTTVETFELFTELLKMGGQRLPKIDPKKYPQGSVPQQPYNQPAVAKAVAGEPAQPAVQQVAQGSSQAVQPVVTDQPVPDSWTKPKVYKGTTVS